MASVKKHLPQKVKDKISATKKEQYIKGILKLPDNTGNTPWNLKKPWSNEVKLKISKSMKGKTPWNTGRKWTSEEIDKLRAGAKRMWKRRKAANNSPQLIVKS